MNGFTATAAIRARLVQHISSTLVEVGHRLKGSCAVLGATTLARLWGEIQRHGQDGATVAVAPLPSALEDEWARVRDALEELVQSNVGS